MTTVKKMNEAVINQVIDQAIDRVIDRETDHLIDMVSVRLTEQVINPLCDQEIDLLIDLLIKSAVNLNPACNLLLGNLLKNRSKMNQSPCRLTLLKNQPLLLLILIGTISPHLR
jgi:hypothetical protein